MAVLLILCDADKVDTRTELLKDVIKEFGDALPLSHSSFLVYSELTSDDVARSLKQKIGSSELESLVVITVPPAYDGPAPLQVKLWFENVRRKIRNDCTAAVAVLTPEPAGAPIPKKA